MPRPMGLTRPSAAPDGRGRERTTGYRPGPVRVLVVGRPKYACRACETQAPAPARLIEGGLPTEATVAQVLVTKYADHLPRYRQAQIYARQGLDLDRSASRAAAQ
jgi:transposase